MKHAKKIYEYILQKAVTPLALRCSIAKLKKTERKLLIQGETLFDVPLVFKGYGIFKSIRPKQVISELQQLYQKIVEAEVKYVCEIGTLRGGTFYWWCQAAQDDAVLVSIDLLSERWDGFFSPHRIEFYKNFGKSPRQELHFIAADSHRQSTFNHVASLLNGEPLDFLFIDGDHTYQGVKQDFELYKPLVRKGGFIALHDILPRKELSEIEVYRFWNEIKETYHHWEIIADDGRLANLIGIGIIQIAD